MIDSPNLTEKGGLVSHSSLPVRPQRFGSVGSPEKPYPGAWDGPRGSAGWHCRSRLTCFRVPFPSPLGTALNQRAAGPVQRRTPGGRSVRTGM